MSIDEPKPDIDFRVSLRNSSNNGELVTFVATPDVIETRNVNYKTIDPVHAPGQIFAYTNTSSRNFNLSSIKLISRTPKEAARNLEKLWLLRSWTMPRFGASTLGDDNRAARERILQERGRQAQYGFTDTQLETYIRSIANKLNIGRELRGEPPVVLLLSAYSNGKTNQMQHINRVPVVIQNMSIPYPADVDYIPAEGSGVPMPTIMTLDMTLAETHSPNEYEKFSLTHFKNGTLAGF